MAVSVIWFTLPFERLLLQRSSIGEPTLLAQKSNGRLGGLLMEDMGEVAGFATSHLDTALDGGAIRGPLEAALARSNCVWC
ncbi:MAG TPA: hypothetical protein EYP31_08665 [Roseibacterium sp.]|nr:hypothetical protein [Roseibacterium sp.]